MEWIIFQIEEIEWYGLSFTEACRKQEKIEKEIDEKKIVPLKHIFRAQLIQELKAENEKRPS